MEHKLRKFLIRRNGWLGALVGTVLAIRYVLSISVPVVSVHDFLSIIWGFFPLLSGATIGGSLFGMAWGYCVSQRLNRIVRSMLPKTNYAAYQNQVRRTLFFVFLGTAFGGLLIIGILLPQRATDPLFGLWVPISFFMAFDVENHFKRWIQNGM